MGAPGGLTSWRVVGASVPGLAHTADGTPCQDAHAIAHVGDWLVAAVCDGAGSSSRAGLGAAVGAQALVDGLGEACQDASARAGDGRDDESRDLDAWTEVAARAVERARTAIGEALVAEGEAADLSLAHTTLVACALGPVGGALFHIGDGLATALGPDGAIVSPPENGAFANETFFLTEPEWAAHLRTTVVPGPVESVWLLSDGAAALATSGGALLQGFADPVSTFLSGSTTVDGTAALRDTLASSATAHLTDDDKTIVWAAPTGGDATPRVAP